MLVIALLLLSVKLYFFIRKIPFELNFSSLAQALVVIIVVSIILFSILNKLKYDKKWEEDYEKRFGKSDEPSNFFDGWLHMNDDVPKVWGFVYGLAVIVIFSCILYNISKGQDYFHIIKYSAFPMFMYDTLLMVDFKIYYAQSKFKLPYILVWFFEIICIFVVVCIIAFILIVAVIIVGGFIIEMICLMFPILMVIRMLNVC